MLNDRINKYKRAVVSQLASGSPGAIWKGAIAELDGLRGIAIFLVFIVHWWPSPNPQSWSWQYVKTGWVGVDLFFVISGFLICGILMDTCKDAHYYRNFYARRTLRIFPLYYAFLIVVFTFIPLGQGGGYFQTPFLKESGSPVWYFCYLSNFALILHECPFLLVPLWSLAIEEQFYICFPFLVAVLNHNRLWKLIIGIIFAALLFRIITYLLFPEIGVQLQRAATPARMDAIAWGGLLAVGLRTGRFQYSPRASTVLLVSTFAVAIWAFYAGWLNHNLPYGRTISYTIIGAVFFTVLLWTLLHRDRMATVFLRFPPLQYLGKICYGSYILHRVAEGLLVKTIRAFGMVENPESVLLFMGKVGTTVVLASISWFLFERPILKLKDRFTSTHHPEGALTVS